MFGQLGVVFIISS